MTRSFNDLPGEAAERLLFSCFADHDWAASVAAGRPYRDLAGLLDAAESAWARLTSARWLAAFAAHPRIGESGGHAPELSRREQTGVSVARDETRAALASENRRYEERFGHVFLIAAHGRSAGELLSELRRRMNNDPGTELGEAAREQREITRLRLERLFPL
jgi:OHCU decarboxylase